MVTTPTIGQLNWGAPLNAALNDLQNQINQRIINVGWAPQDQGFIQYTVDPALPTNTAALVSGTLTVGQVMVRAAATVNRLAIRITGAGAGLTAGQNFLGLYNSAGSLVAQTADQSAAWTATGQMMPVVTAPVGIAAGKYWIAVLSNGATPPTLRCANQGGDGNFALTGASLRFATAAVAQTVLPASFVPAALVSQLNAWWLGVL